MSRGRYLRIEAGEDFRDEPIERNNFDVEDLTSRSIVPHVGELLTKSTNRYLPQRSFLSTNQQRVTVFDITIADVVVVVLVVVVAIVIVVFVVVSTIQYNTMQCNAMQCNVMQCYAMRCDAMRYDTIRYNTIQYNIQYNTIQCLGDLKNPAKLPVWQVLEGTDYSVLLIFKISSFSTFPRSRTSFFAVAQSYSVRVNLKSRWTSPFAGARGYWLLGLMNFRNIPRKW